jgi:phosphatidylserine/phosphatidylglycerophosphate/cardiolipin synthase-like enzyme
MSGLAENQDRLIVALAHRASLCSKIFKAWASVGSEVPVGVRELTGAAHLSHSDEVGTSDVLRILHGMGMLEGQGPRWKPKPTLASIMEVLALIFGGIETYKSRVQKNATEVDIIATRPGRAVAFDRELANAGWQTPRPEETDESIAGLFVSAARSIVVMTPFLDQRGGSILKALLERAHDHVRITLILRYLDRRARNDYPAGFPLIVDWLRERRVSVFNYSLEQFPGAQIETFHAKLILVDGARAYVGSANMTGSSFETSVELGVILAGEAARQLSHLVDVILRCATPWPLAPQST